MTLTFDEATHTYTLNGKTAPSVTSVIRTFSPAWDCGAFYLHRGRAYHRGIELMLRGCLAWHTVDLRIEPRLRAAEKFIREHGLDVRDADVEWRRANETYWFAGTIDLHCSGVLVDWKSSSGPADQVQLGAYSLLVPKPKCGYAVVLKDDGTYGYRRYDAAELRDGGRVFLAALTMFGWLERHGLLKAPEVPFEE